MKPIPGALAALLVTLCGGRALAQPRRVQAPSATCEADRPIASAWPVTRSWDARAEAEYGVFVQSIGRAVDARRCRTLAACLDSPATNPLYVRGHRSGFRADCADVPYILRAYFSWRRHLPFVHAGAVRGEPDPRGVRYSANNVPAGPRRSSDYATPRSVFRDVGSTVHSGFFRLRPELEDTDTYPARVDRQGVRPGTAFYDPDGHVLVVYQVGADGEVRLIDGHPGGSLTARRFSHRLTLGSSAQGGGFRNFRPVVLRNGAWTRPRNAELPDYDRAAQHDAARWVVGGQPVGYHAWVRNRLVRHM